MASELSLGRGRRRPRLFLFLLLLFLVLGTSLASAVTGADYVRGNGAAKVPDDRPSGRAAFSPADDRCVLVVPTGENGEPQAFLLWRLCPAAGTMIVTALAADTPGDPGETLAELFGDGGRIGCEAVCRALTRSHRGAPQHYVVLTETALRAVTDRLPDTLSLPTADWPQDVRVTLAWDAQTQSLGAGQLLALLREPPSAYAGGQAAYTRLRGAVWESLCRQLLTPARLDRLSGDFATLASAAETDLTISHFTAYRSALTALIDPDAES